ncbi:phage tail protein [Ancylomarina sp.]|uniref:phage tail protein n=1 Tax=Ancylomarina sp. TaxID=1970196 RepID=UPI00356A7033
MEAFLSFIGIWPLKWAPNYWALCWGQTISINDNPALYSLLGTTYGGDGRSYFKLPDFRGRVQVGYGSGIGLIPTTIMGQIGGVEKVQLTQNEMPTHTHAAALSSVSVSFKASDQPGTESKPGENNAKTIGAGAGKYAATLYNTEVPNVSLDGVSASGGNISVNNAGLSQYHENRQPYTVTNYIMSMQGIFPPRP